MRETGEWGESFPPFASPYAYNETMAHQFFPLEREIAESLGYSWKERDEREYQPQTMTLPDKISDAPDSITSELLACQSCKKNYRITLQELKFHRKLSIPLSDKCPDCRYSVRTQLRNSMNLWPRICSRCAKDVQSSYGPSRAETVLCEECYLKEFH